MSSSFTTPEAAPASSSPHDGPPSPEAPPYSPISPVAPEFPSLNQAAKAPRPDFMNAPPPPEPIDQTSNPDAIALRAAISVLQVQRQRALADLQTLEQQKQQATAHPEAFAKALTDGTVRARQPQGILGAPEDSASEDSDTEMHDAGNNKDAAEEIKGPKKRGKTTKETKGGPVAPPIFGQIPGPQNVVRTPPINWAKYHVAGEALDKLHQEQQQRPDPGLPLRDPGLRPPEHQIAAPYSPWKDNVPQGPPRARPDPKKG